MSWATIWITRCCVILCTNKWWRVLCLYAATCLPRFTCFHLNFSSISSLTRTQSFFHFDFSLHFYLFVISFLHFCVCTLHADRNLDKVDTKRFIFLVFLLFFFLSSQIVFVFDSRCTGCHIPLSFFIAIQTRRAYAIVCATSTIELIRGDAETDLSQCRTISHALRFGSTASGVARCQAPTSVWMPCKWENPNMLVHAIEIFF